MVASLSVGPEWTSLRLGIESHALTTESCMYGGCAVACATENCMVFL